MDYGVLVLDLWCYLLIYGIICVYAMHELYPSYWVRWFKWLHAYVFLILIIGSRSLLTCLRSNYTIFDIPRKWFCFQAFLFLFSNKNMRAKMFRVFPRSNPTAFIPIWKRRGEGAGGCHYWLIILSNERCHNSPRFIPCHHSEAPNSKLGSYHEILNTEKIDRRHQ